jgi:hypothetical protein
MHGNDRDRRKGKARPGASPGGPALAPAGGVPGKGTRVAPTAAAPLPAALRERLERSLSMDLSAVRVGEDPRVAAMGARALASGTSVVFAPGAYQPDTPEGQALIAHEVVHLGQQADRPVEANAAAGGVAIHHDAGLEREADDLGARALEGEVVRTGGGAPRDAAMPYQGFFDDLIGAVGDLVDTAATKVETVVEKVKTVAKDVGAKVEEMVALADPLLLPEDDAGSFALQRLLESTEITVVGGAYDALVAAKAIRTEGQALDVITFSADGTDYSIQAAPRVTDAMIPAFSMKRDELAFLPVDPVWTEFAVRFNASFASVVNSFDLAEARFVSSKFKLIAARLKYLFTDHQRELLTDFMDTNRIPDRLFDGDEVGNATAQQRIMIAGKILSNGKYKPGSFTQTVHARMCYHYADIVWQYAGVAGRSGNHRMALEFDLYGGLVLNNGELENEDGKPFEVFGAKQDKSLDPTSDHLAKTPNAYRQRNAPWELLENLRAGDWLYIYTENKTGPGTHSVIFAGWVSPAYHDEAAGHHWREALIFHQPMPDKGGRESTVVLGNDLFSTPQGKARPVNMIKRTSASSRPMDSADDLSPASADSADKKNKRGDTPNEKFKDRFEKDGKIFDDAKFMAWMREENHKRIAQLMVVDHRLTAGQYAMFLEANRSEREVEVICLYQRLVELEWDSNLLDEKKEKHTEQVDEDYREEMGPYYADKTVLEVKLLEAEADQFWINLEAEQILHELEPLTHSAAIRALTLKRKAAARKINHLKGAEKRATIDEVHAHDDEIKDLMTDAKTNKKTHKAEIAVLQSNLEDVKKRYTKATRRIKNLEYQIAKLEKKKPAVYETVNTPHSRGEAKVDVTGRCADMPGVPWEDFVISPP